MPSTKKTLHFISSALVTAISVGLMGFAMSTQWAKTTIECARAETDAFNGSAEIFLGLFQGRVVRVNCLFGDDDPFDVFPLLSKTGTAPVALYALVVCLLALCLLFSAVSILISLYNSVSNPYETYMGPAGVYTCSSISTCLSVLVLIIFVVTLNVTSLVEDVVRNFVGGTSVELRNKSADMRLGYYLIIPYAVLCLVSIGLIYMYDHAAYTQRREQQRPTEDAPKEIMMY